METMFRIRMFNKMTLLLNAILILMLLINEVIAVKSSDEMRNNSTSTTTAAVPVSNINMKRERSAMISNNLDSIKDISDSDGAEKASTWSSRKLDLGRSRNLKLSSILHHQRRLQNKWQPSEECQRRCKNSSTDDFCRLKCRTDSKQIEVVKSVNTTNDTKTEVNISVPPTLQQSKEELAEESVILRNIVNRNKNNESDEAATKEIFNMINDKEKLRKDFQQMIESSTKFTTNAAKINRRKYTRTSVLPLNQTKPTVFRGRVKYSPSNFRPSLNEENIDPNLQASQKLILNRKFMVDKRTSSFLQSTTPMMAQTKDNEFEIMEVSVSKPTSTEKNIFWKARNIIAINNYMRKLNPHLTKFTDSKVETTTRPPMQSYEILHEKSLNENKTTIENNITVPTKIIYSRPTSIPNSIKSPIVPPVFYTDNRNYQQSDGEFDVFQITTLESPTTQIANTSSPFDYDDEAESKIIKFLNKSSAINESKYEVITANDRRTNKPNTSSTLEKSSAILTSTISTFLSNVSSFKNKDATKTLLTLPTSSRLTTTTTPITIASITKSSILKNVNATTPMTFDEEQQQQQETKTVIPDQVEEVPKSFIATTANNYPSLYGGISTTSKPQINGDVYIESQRINLTVYASIGIIFIILIIIVPLVVRQYILKNEKKDDDIENYSNDIQPISPVVTMAHSDDGNCSEGDESIISEALEINRNKLKFKSLLGEGNFGQVWKAEIEDHSDPTGIKIVAVKTERSNNGQGGLKAECEIMRKLLPAHPNVVTLLGACIEQEPHLVIMSYEMRGKLLSLLRTARGVMNSGNLYHVPNNRESSMPLSPRRLTGFAYDIAKGMEYIVEKGIVHGDIAARNVLVDQNGYCKICDFGMSIDLNKRKKHSHIHIPRVPTYQNAFKFEMTTRIFGGLKNYAISKTRPNSCDVKNRPALPIRWMSPESLQYHVYSHESDVFAFGIVLWEIATLGITPYPTLTGREVIRGVIRDNIRPDIPPNCKQELSQIMSQCWLKEARERPTFTDVRKELFRTLNHWEEEINTNQSEYLDVSGFSEDYENGMIYFNRRVSEFECEI